MPYNVYDQVFPVEKVRKGIVDTLFERYNEEEKTALYEAFLEERMKRVKYLLMPGPDFNEFKIKAYFESKRGNEIDLKDIFKGKSYEPTEFVHLMIAINANDRASILYRINNITKESFAEMGIDKEAILKGDTIDYDSEEFSKLKTISQEINVMGTKRSHTESEYASKLKGKWHLVDNFMIS